jgi:adenylosuccinate lyase
VPAQVTTVGKRLAMFGTEMLCAHRALEDLIARYPLRGLKGPVGTQLDLATLFGDQQKVDLMERRIASALGFSRVLSAVGQVYPRELDLEVVAALCQLSSGPSSLAKTLRLMAGQDLASEGFQAGQVGSSAMPHKVNARSCERINGFNVVLRGFVAMAAGLAGDQWNEGDVSCSVVRRVALPGSMFAIDGTLETFLTVVQQMTIFEPAIEAEVARQLPFLATTTILMESVKRGRGRESAHEAIKEHALAASKALREGAGGDGGLVDRLAGDQRIGLGAAEIKAILVHDERFTGSALAQVDAFVDAVDDVSARFPGASDYRPASIL